MIVGELEDWIEFDSDEWYDNFLRLRSRNRIRSGIGKIIESRPILGIVPRALRLANHAGLGLEKRVPIAKRVITKKPTSRTATHEKRSAPKQTLLAEEKKEKKEKKVIPQEVSTKELKQQPLAEEQVAQKEESKTMYWIIGGVLVLLTVTAVGITIKQLSKKQEA
jgi:hypothetical protein